MTEAASFQVAVVLFEGFELLDVFGPVELLSLVPRVEIRYCADAPGPATSSQGARVETDGVLDDIGVVDLLLVPGGRGTRPLATSAEFLGRLGGAAARARLVGSVCTGSALLAAAGLLDGYRATSNKAAFTWATSVGGEVDWIGEARWVHDRDRWTSSGVAAGMDMTVALIREELGEHEARASWTRAEYEPHEDAAWDPFAAVHGVA